MCNGKAVTPGTDNFEIASFVFEGVTYYSAEQFYQVLKMRKAADRAKIQRCVPKPGEKAWDYGMRAWQAGQLGAARKDWEAVKVEAMYFANKLKLEQNSALLASLLASNGTPQGRLSHMGSGKFWDQWNPTLLMLLREELSPGGGDAERIAALHAQMEAYRVGKHGASLLAELTLSGGPAVHSLEERGSGAEGEGESSSPAAAEDAPFEGNILELFRQLDADGSGIIERSQLLTALRRIDSSWTDEHVDRVLVSTDAPGVAIRYEELVSRIFLDACERMRA